MNGFKVRNYIEFLKKNADEIGMEFSNTPVNAKGLALICAFNGVVNENASLLPWSVQWGMLSKVFDSEAYKKGVLETVKNTVASFKESDLKEGVKDILAGKPFTFKITVGEHIYSMAVTPNQKALEDLTLKEEGLKDLCVKSDYFRRAMALLEAVDGKPLMLAARPEFILDMDYVELTVLLNCYVKIHEKMTVMNWEGILKNS